MIIRNLLATAAVVATSAPAMANGLSSHYVGSGVAIGLDGQGAAAALIGRVAVPLSPVMLSLRPQVNIEDSVEAAVGATVDVPVATGTNLYVGGGVAFRDEDSSGVLTMNDPTVGYVQAGVEYGLAEHVAIYGDAKVAFGSETIVIPTVGMSYRF
jgi:hypothetical protein